MRTRRHEATHARSQGPEERVLPFLRDLPKLHQLGDQPAHSGGLNPLLGRVFMEELSNFEAPTIIETGAGNTTLLFMMLGCSSVTSIAPDGELEQRIYHEAKQRDLDLDVLTFINDRSERALPRLALEGSTTCQAALIDGNHGWPSVFVDFCYLNMMMPEGALLFVDDVHLYSCEQLMLLLRAQQSHYEFVRADGKMATFRKTNSKEFLPDWRHEPFIYMNTGPVRPTGA
jgi:hypothetical protein